MKVEDYIILTNVLTDDLTKQIVTYLCNDYELYGSPFVHISTGEFCQAMIKYENL